MAIDGSKFKAVNNRDRNFTGAKMKRRLQQIEESIDRYLSQLDTADRQESSEVAQAKVDACRTRSRRYGSRCKSSRHLKSECLRLRPTVSLTDLDARSMNSRGSGIVGYNVQTAVDADHHLIVAHEVSNVGSDRG